MALTLTHLLIAMAAAFLAGGINSVAGGGTLITLAAVFERMVPFLILFATLLFTVQAPIQRRLSTVSLNSRPRTRKWMIGAMLAQFAVGIYGGYFGAGMSIMMLTALAFMGMEDILQMSAMTSFLSFCTNGVASIFFAASHMVVWPYVLGMMLAAILGGYAAAGVARKIGKVMVRRFVIAVGFTITIVLMVKMF